MPKNKPDWLFAYPILIVWFLLYLTIFHSHLFSWINLELLKQFTPDIFMPIKRANGILYNEAILSGAISFISIFLLPIYYFLQAKKNVTQERLNNILKQQGKYGYIKIVFMFIFVFSITIFFLLEGINDSKPSNLTVKKWITSDPQRHLFMDISVLNMFYMVLGALFFLVISPLFFNIKKEK